MEVFPSSQVWILEWSSIWTWGRTSSLWGWWSTGTGCPEGLWSLLLWRYSSPAWMRSCAACSGWPCFGRRVGLGDPQRSLPTPTILWFCDSVTPLQLFWVGIWRGLKYRRRVSAQNLPARHRWLFEAWGWTQSGRQFRDLCNWEKILSPSQCSYPLWLLEPPWKLLVHRCERITKRMQLHSSLLLGTKRIWEMEDFLK